MSKSTYQRTTFKDFTKRLSSGEYKTQRAALCAASRSVTFSTEEKAEAHAAAKKYFAGKTKTKTPAPASAPTIKKATVNSFKKEAPFCVTFAKTVRDQDASALMLNFLRGAADTGMTLPDLIGAIEAV